MCIENMVNYATNFIKPILKGDIRTVEVKKEAEVAWTNDIQQQLKKTVFHTGGCNNWYVDKNGWNSTVLPYSQIWFWYWCKFPRWRDWNITYTRKGITKVVLSRLLKAASVLVFVLGWYRASAEGGSLRSYLAQLRSQAENYTKLGALLAINQARKRLKTTQNYIMNL
jgi:hypothetical protein